jgi:hypothetical protein
LSPRRQQGAGAQFPCFTGTKAQILTRNKAQVATVRGSIAAIAALVAEQGPLRTLHTAAALALANLTDAHIKNSCTAAREEGALLLLYYCCTTVLLLLYHCFRTVLLLRPSRATARRREMRVRWRR